MYTQCTAQRTGEEHLYIHMLYTCIIIITTYGIRHEHEVSTLCFLAEDEDEGNTFLVNHLFIKGY